MGIQLRSPPSLIIWCPDWQSSLLSQSIFFRVHLQMFIWRHNCKDTIKILVPYLKQVLALQGFDSCNCNDFTSKILVNSKRSSLKVCLILTISKNIHSKNGVSQLAILFYVLLSNNNSGWVEFIHSQRKSFDGCLLPYLLQNKPGLSINLHHRGQMAKGSRASI